VHRIGRTGRAGNEGAAISLVCQEEFKLLKDIEKLIKKMIPRKTLAGFEPGEPLPPSVLGNTSSKPKKAKKPRPNGGRGNNPRQKSVRDNFVGE